MVDAIATATTKRSAAGSSAAAGRRVNDATASVELDAASYAEFVADKTFAPAQSPNWVDAWTRHGGADSAIVLIRQPNGAELALPLDISSLGPVKVARFMSGRHANGNFPAARGPTGSLDVETLAQAVHSVRPDIDLILLERMAQSVGGATNPLAHLPGQTSPNPSLAVDLDGGFDAVLGRTSGKRKRKKHRSQTRKFEAVGQIRMIEAATDAEVDRILSEFFVLKAARFKTLGLKDVFADAGTQTFFRNLFKSGLAGEPRPFVLNALEVGGKIRAITGSSRVADRIVCEFGAIASDDLGHASPGEFLFYDNIRRACEEGRAVYDFSVGDEYYKRLWCNIEERQFDVRIPVSMSGRLLGGALGAAARAKRAIKSNPVLWSAIKKVRRSKAGAAEAETDDD